MRRTIIGLTILGLLAIAPAVQAAPISSADLADDCNTDGKVTISGHLVVQGGTGILKGPCVVFMDAKATLTMRKATLVGDGGFVIANALYRARVRVKSSVIDLTGPVQLSPGCCAGSGDRNESTAAVVVMRSILRGETVEVSASVDDSRGTARVHGSLLESTVGTVAVGASLSGGKRGKVAVTSSTLLGATTIRIATGEKGRTLAAGNSFTAPGGTTVTNGPGGTCLSFGNSPPTSCS